jgi:hypothetical protein
MGQATIFAGQKIKTLKSTLNLNGGADVVSSTTDPTSVAVDAQPGSLLLNTISGKLYRKNDSGSSTNWSEVGSGGSGINYISNPSAATNTTGWATYADAAGAQPVDGTGGSPNVTWTRSTTTPLRGSADFNFSKDAVNRQGQGVSTDFTIDLADQAKVLTVTFDYEVLSGTYADGDLTVYLIADPAGTPVVIQPAGYVVQNATVGTKMKQIATFQTQATGQSYRLCFHVASVSALAYTLAIDNVVVGPQVVQYGAPVTDWVSYTPTINWTAGVGFGIFGRYRRVGDSLHAQVYIPISGAVTAAQLYVSIPTGFTIDSTKLAGPIGLNQTNPNGTWTAIRTGVAIYNGVVAAITSTQVWLTVNGNGNVLTNTIPATWANNDYISCEFFVPVTGWSSTVQMSNDTDTRVVAARYTTTAANTTADATTTSLDFNGTTFDTHSAGSGGGGSPKVYTIPVSGFYKISAALLLGSQAWSYAATRQVQLQTTGSQPNISLDIVGLQTSFTGYITLKGSLILYFSAGNTVGLALSNTSGASVSLNANAAVNYFQVERVSGPATIAANEAVAMRAYKTSGSHTNNGNNQTVASYNASPFDTHGAFNITTGEYTVPVSGTYLVAGTIGFSPNATGVRALQIEVDLSRKLGGEVRTADGSNVNTLNFSGLVTAIAGQKITVSTFQNSGGNLNYDTTSNYNSLSIVRVGN